MNVAAEWNAIVLLDEADVFLQKRLPENLERNERVAGRFFRRQRSFIIGSPTLNQPSLSERARILQR